MIDVPVARIPYLQPGLPSKVTQSQKSPCSHDLAARDLRDFGPNLHQHWKICDRKPYLFKNLLSAFRAFHSALRKDLESPKLTTAWL